MTVNVRFRQAMAQAHEIKRRKSVKGKQRQIARWCEMVKEAIRGTGYKGAPDKE